MTRQTDLFPKVIAATLVVAVLGSVLGGGWWILGVGVLAVAVVQGLRQAINQ